MQQASPRIQCNAPRFWSPTLVEEESGSLQIHTSREGAGGVMLEGYIDYFNTRLTEVDEFLPTDEAGRGAAREAVSVARDVAEQNGQSLRPDAALLIYVLSHELVARPVLNVLPEQHDQVGLAVAQDVSQIMNAAAGFGGEQITAHTVIDALSSSWQDLATAQFQMWDGH
jgi:nucleotide-binding universal stress UspA family protein